MMREAAFRAAIGDWSVPAPHSRFGIYRNNVASALINALRVRYPVTEQLVGEEFFTAMAGSFAEGNRPCSPVLISYGADLPDFIRDFPPAASVAYLSDVAALESLWWQAYHAADEALAQPQAFSAIDADHWGNARLRFHPSLGLIASPYAVASIWQAHRGGRSMAEIRISAGEHVLVARPGADVTVRLISAASYDFIASLRNDTSLAEAVEQASHLHPDFDIAAQIRGLIALNIITGFST